MAQKTILAIGDIHLPYANMRSLRRVVDLATEIKPHIIIQIGDLYDLYSFSRFPRSLNHLTPKAELEWARSDAMDMWERLRKAAPAAKRFQLKGNHDERVSKIVIAKAPEIEHLLDVHSIFKFKDVETVESERDELILGDILFMHGFRSKLGQHTVHNNMNTVCGHTHQGGVVYQRLGKKTIWELNCGFIADTNSHVMSYTRQRHISKWTQGVGLIDENGPRFIPFENK